MPLGAARIALFSRPAEVTRDKVTVVAEGNAQISTTESVFGGASAEFNASGEYLRIERDNNLFAINNDNDITFEGWVYFNNFTSRNVIFTNRTGGATTTGYVFFVEGNNWTWRFFNGSGSFNDIVYSTSVPVDQWIHFSILRSDLTWNLYIDGQLEGSVTETITTTDNNVDLHIGIDPTNTGRNLDGYIDEFRISNTARYTANFTPPTEPFQNDDNTLLLLHMDGTDGSQTFVDDNGV